jgi:hypothetical protein
MTINNWLLSASVLMILNVVGCGPAALPYPTEKKVSPTQIVGKWQYDTDYDEATVTLVLNADGSFVQNVPKSSLGGARVQRGLWSLDGADLFLENALRYNYGQNRWETTGYNCWIIDEFGLNSSFTLFGGDGFQDDPDSGDVFERVP